MIFQKYLYMYLQNGISAVEYSKCNKNIDNLEVLRMPVFIK
jgi:hypothetical protein